jgi:hypothetical protein
MEKWVLGNSIWLNDFLFASIPFSASDGEKVATGRMRWLCHLPPVIMAGGEPLQTEGRHRAAKIFQSGQLGAIFSARLRLRDG